MRVHNTPCQHRRFFVTQHDAAFRQSKVMLVLPSELLEHIGCRQQLCESLLRIGVAQQRFKVTVSFLCVIALLLLLLLLPKSTGRRASCVSIELLGVLLWRWMLLLLLLVV